MKRLTVVKKLLLVLLAAGTLFVCFSFPLAETLPDATFSSEVSHGFAGGSVTLTIQLSAASDTWTMVRLRSVSTGYRYGVRIDAGQTIGTLTVPAPKDTASEPTPYEIIQGVGYAIGQVSTCAASAVDFPQFTFGKDLLYGIPGKSLIVPVFCKKTKLLSNPVTLTLVSESGEKLGSLQYKSGAQNKSIKIKFPSVTGETATLYLYAYEYRDTPIASLTLPTSNCSYKGIRSVERSDGLVGLSFDCAYGEKHTDNIISILKEYNSTATFFMIANWVGNHGPWIDRIIAGGNEAGNHSKTHQRMGDMYPSRVSKELVFTNDAIEAATGTKPTLFRPPYGDGSIRLTSICHYYGLEVVYWTIDSHDWDTSYTTNMIVRRVCSDVKSGDIILFHNGAPLAEQYLPIVLQYLADNGLRGVKISDMLYKDNYTVDENGRQRLIEGAVSPEPVDAADASASPDADATPAPTASPEN